MKWFIVIAGAFAIGLAIEGSPKFGGMLLLLLVGGMLITAQRSNKI
jgi:hypothetical protein